MVSVYLVMLKFTDEQLDWLVERILIREPSPKGGRSQQGELWLAGAAGLVLWLGTARVLQRGATSRT